MHVSPKGEVGTDQALGFHHGINDQRTGAVPGQEAQLVKLFLYSVASRAKDALRVLRQKLKEALSGCAYWASSPSLSIFRNGR